MKKYITKNLTSFIKKDAKKIKKNSQLNLTEIQNKLSQCFGYRHFHELNKALEAFKINPTNFALIEEMSFSERLDFSGEIAYKIKDIIEDTAADFSLSCASMSTIPFTQVSYTQSCGNFAYEYDLRKLDYQIEMTTNEHKKYFMEYLNLIKDKALQKTVGIPYSKTNLYTPCYILADLIFDIMKINNTVFCKDAFMKYATLEYLFQSGRNSNDELLNHTLNTYFTSVLDVYKIKSKNIEEKYIFHKDVLKIFEMILNNKFLLHKSEDKMNVSSLKHENVKFLTYEKTNKHNYEIASLICMLKKT